MKPNLWLDWKQTFWPSPSTLDTCGAERKHPEMIKGRNWWQNIHSCSYLYHLARAPQSCFLIRPQHSSRNIHVWVQHNGSLGMNGAIGRKICISHCSDVNPYGVRKWEYFQHKPKRDSAAEGPSFDFSPVCSISVCHLYLPCCSFIISAAPSFHRDLQWLWLQLPSYLSGTNYESLCIRVLQND